MFIGQHIVKVDCCNKEDDPEGQQHQQAVANGHDALVVPVGGGVWQCCRLLGVQVMTVAAGALLA